MNLSNAVKKLREMKGWSLTQMSEKSGLTTDALEAIENGKDLEKEDAEKIACALDVPVILVIAMGVERGDVMQGKEEAYDALKPDIDNLIASLLTP